MARKAKVREHFRDDIKSLFVLANAVTGDHDLCAETKKRLTGKIQALTLDLQEVDMQEKNGN